MKKIYITLLMAISLISLSVIGVKAFANEEALRTQVDEMTYFVESHLNEFKNEYNHTADKPLEASRIESYCLTYIIDEDEYGVYIDFDGEHGYLLTTFTYVLYVLETEGDLPYLRDVDFTYYSIVDGFVYHNGTNYVRYDQITTYNNSEIVYGYNGQSSTGEGDIYNIDSYMADRYSSYKLEETVEDIRKTYEFGFNMTSLSTFIERVSTDGGYTYPLIYPERNCALVAVFNVLSSWGETGYFSGMPARTDYKENFYDTVTQDSLYAEYGTGHGGVGISSYWTLNSETYLRRAPELYVTLRRYSKAGDNYTPVSGLTTAQARNAFIYGTSDYHHTIYPKQSTSFADVMTSLQENRAVFMGVVNSTTFGENHAVALLGYRKYSYKTGVWIFQQSHTAYFYMIDDGQMGSLTYFDPNCNSKLSYEFIYA